MGNSASKAAKTAVQGAKRQYPTTPSIPAASSIPKVPNIETQAHGPQVHSNVPASEARNDAINRDAFDPQLGAALRSLGPVRPLPTQSNSSTAQAQPEFESGLNPAQPVFPNPKNNPALLVLESRNRQAEQYTAEVEQYGRKGFQGKRFLDASVIRHILVMRDLQGKGENEIEEKLELYPGVVQMLKRGVFGVPDLGDAGEVRR